MSAYFDPEPRDKRPYIYRMELDCGIQVKEPYVDAFTQTPISFKRNKMIQSSMESISDENVEIIMKSRSMANFFKNVI